MKESTEVALRDLAAKMEEASVARTPPLPVYESPAHRAQSLNLTRRARALHMRSRGEGPQIRRDAGPAARVEASDRERARRRSPRRFHGPEG